MSFLTLPLLIILLALVVLSLFGALTPDITEERLYVIPEVLRELLDIYVRTLIQGVVGWRWLVLWDGLRFFYWGRVLMSRGAV
jgi:ligand-binding sensor domain-containing protein